jgi:sulfide:quinone oxidoreductase
MSRPSGAGTPVHVLVAGGGVAGLEALVGLRDLAGDRVALTLVEPEPAFTIRARSVGEPFAADRPRIYDLAAIAADLDATVVVDRVAAVDAAAHRVRCASGAEHGYDVLVLALGADAEPPYEHAITFATPGAAVQLGGLLSDLERRDASRVAFVVPPSSTWTLPLYELALLTAHDVQAAGAKGAELVLVTTESAPLEMFGRRASDAVAALLEAGGVAFASATRAEVGAGHVLLDGGDRRLDVDRVVTIPRLSGRPVGGIPAGAGGFVAVDGFGRVAGRPGVFAAGDLTDFPVKQGGLACQQADAVAETIAAQAGAPVHPDPFRPVLRGALMTGDGLRFLRNEGIGGDGGDVDEKALWWPPEKVAGRHLTRYLSERDTAELTGRPAAHVPVDPARPAGRLAHGHGEPGIELLAYSHPPPEPEDG